MRLKNICAVIRLFSLVVALFSALFVSGCCSGRYSYYSYKVKAEEALKKKDYKKAKNYYSIIYNNEKKVENINRERTTWAFYRLGVISEVSGDLDLARGYYWGDSIDEDFYEGEALTNWFARAGWKQMDEKKTPRTLEEIFEFEKTEPKEEETVVVERKKEDIRPKRTLSAYPPRRPNKTGVITKTYNRSRTPPERGTPEPFKVYY